MDSILFKICLTCGKEFSKRKEESNPSWKKKKFCSRVCVRYGPPSKEKRERIGTANRGEQNGNFGKSAWNTGKICPQLGYDSSLEKNANWKGGKPNCPICGKKLSSRKSKFCIKHRDNRGSKNPRWLGGKSFEPYCPKFTQSLREEIRNKYDRKCFLCEKSETENTIKLSIHHIDYDKQQGCDGKKWELVSLCSSCHTATNNSRIKYQELIREKLQRIKNGNR